MFALKIFQFSLLLILLCLLGKDTLVFENEYLVFVVATFGSYDRNNYPTIRLKNQ
jgi:hypothetical protein